MARVTAGSQLPDAFAPRLGGGRVRLSEAWEAAPGLLAVGHADCETTRLALPFVERLHRRRPGAVLAVLQEPEAGARALVDELGLELPVALDEDPYPVCSSLGVEVVPTLILVAAGGVVQHVVEGFRRDRLEALAAALGAGPLFEAGDTAPAHRPG
jgi:hypothetical protein